MGLNNTKAWVVTSSLSLEYVLKDNPTNHCMASIGTSVFFYTQLLPSLLDSIFWRELPFFLLIKELSKEQLPLWEVNIFAPWFP